MTDIRIRLLTAVIVFTISVSTVHGLSYVPVDHRVYDFLERMENMYFTSGLRMATKPVTRTRIATMLEGMKGNADHMSPVDREEYQLLMAEFINDLPDHRSIDSDDKEPLPYIPGFLKSYLYRNRRNMLSTVDRGYLLYLDPIVVRSGRFSSAGGEDKRVYTAGNGFLIWGSVGDHVGFHVDIRDSKEWGTRDYPELKQSTTPGRGYVSFKGDRAEFDETQAHIAYTNGPFVLSYGSDRLEWGHGASGTLAMSSYAAPFDMFRLESEFWRMRFVFFTGEIEQFPPIAKFYYYNPANAPDDSVTVKKYMTGHRVEIDVTERVSIGFHETVIYGGRWDASYINPLTFLTGSEHWNGDHDNVAMGLDFRAFVHRAHSVYGELFIDDISMSKLGTDWYGNKLAWQLGTYLVEPFGLLDVDARMEYTRLQPWVYTHKFPINGYHHYGDPLGYYTGPNSDALMVELRKRLTRKLHTSFRFDYLRKGLNPDGMNIGGDHMLGHAEGDPKDAGFLDGEAVDTSLFNLSVSYELFWQCLLHMGYTYERQEDDANNLYTVSFGLNE